MFNSTAPAAKPRLPGMPGRYLKCSQWNDWNELRIVGQKSAIDSREEREGLKVAISGGMKRRRNSRIAFQLCARTSKGTAIKGNH